MPAKKKIAPRSHAAPAHPHAVKKKFPGKPGRRKPQLPAAPEIFEGEVFARAAAAYADGKKAENIVVLDVRGISMVTDFLVICEGTSMPHLRAIRNEIDDRMREDHKIKPYASHGAPDSGWILLDFGDVVVHIFHVEKRAYYSLEDLWSDAPRVG
jgi:ribosome-associated protein